jgi:Rho termination factor, N-terminal domain
MAHTYEELKSKTIAELRDIAKELTDEGVQGYTQMNKDHLLPALCKALGIDARAHHVAHGEVKIKAKARMKALREERQKAVDMHDGAALKASRRELHHLNHRLRVNARETDTP